MYVFRLAVQISLHTGVWWAAAVDYSWNYLLRQKRREHPGTTSNSPHHWTARASKYFSTTCTLQGKHEFYFNCILSDVPSHVAEQVELEPLEIPTYLNCKSFKILLDYTYCFNVNINAEMIAIFASLISCSCQLTMTQQAENINGKKVACEIFRWHVMEGYLVRGWGYSHSQRRPGNVGGGIVGVGGGGHKACGCSTDQTHGVISIKFSGNVYH